MSPRPLRLGGIALPEARLPWQDPGVLGAVAATLVAGPVVRRRLDGPGGEALLAALSLLPEVVALRSGDLAAYHGVEHKAIAAYEARDADARDAPKEHDRCGSHLMAGLRPPPPPRAAPPPAPSGRPRARRARGRRRTAPQRAPARGATARRLLRRFAAVLLGVAACAGGAACGGDGDARAATPIAQPKRPADLALLRIRTPPPLALGEQLVGSAGPMTQRVLRFTATDGQRVPALFASPTASAPRGCLLFEPGLGSRKEDGASLWDQAAALGLAVLTVELRNRSRGGVLDNGASADPRAVAGDLRASALDLRRGLDVLAALPQCAGKPVGYIGISLGGFLGTLVSAADRRVDATVLLVTGARWGDVFATRAGRGLWPFADLRAAARAFAPYDPWRWVARIAPRPVLIVNGRDDHLVPLSTGRRLARAAGRPKATYVYDGEHDALFSAAGPAVRARIAAFLRRTLLR